MYKVVLLRHGQSQWNLENRFTGWTDVDLTPKGELEAKSAGEVLKENGFGFDFVYTSVLKRAIFVENFDSFLTLVEAIKLTRAWQECAIIYSAG